MEALRDRAGGPWRRAMGRPLRSVAEAFLPFRLYEVEVINRGEHIASLFAADAVSGSLDLYEFDHAPDLQELLTIKTRNCAAVCLSEAQSVAALESKVRRLVYQEGFFRVRGLRVDMRRLVSTFYVPYWLGFYGNGERAQLKVMDAVRRRFEGSKARAVFQDWLTAAPAAGAFQAASRPGTGLAP